MILLQPAVHEVLQVWIEENSFNPNRLQRLIGLTKRIGTWSMNPKRQERTRTALIDFEVTPARINVSHPEQVVFGNALYSGILPIRHVYDNIYECSIANVQYVRLEKAFVQPEERRM